jgi:hypothetical protein
VIRLLSTMSIWQSSELVSFVCRNMKKKYMVIISESMGMLIFQLNVYSGVL